MLLPLSYNHLASWIYYSVVFILRLLFINSWSQTFCLFKGFYSMHSSISFTCTSFVVAAFLSVFQKLTFSGFFFSFFSKKFPWRASQRLAWLTVFTKAGCIISPKTESVTYLARALLQELPHHLPLICLFSKDRFLPAAEPQIQSVRSLLFISTMSFGQFGFSHETLQLCPQWVRLPLCFGCWVKRYPCITNC